MPKMAEPTPLRFDVPDMDCEACVAAITQAVRRVDPNAVVSADLVSRRVVIGGEGEPRAFVKAMEAAGYDVKAPV